MQETVLDVLMYLFENYIEDEIEFAPDEASLKLELEDAGFGDVQVNMAFDWLESLAEQKENLLTQKLSDTPSVRIFTDKEKERLDVECRGFLVFLEQVGVLDAHDRELVVDRVMALGPDEIDLGQLKWVILMVLFNQPGKEAAFTWMEDIVLDDLGGTVH
jgi:Smg protein